MIVKVRVEYGKKPPEITENAIVVYTSEKRENNRANIDVMRQLARTYGKSIDQIKLVGGRTSRKKEFLIED
ncbi:MAG: DUF167 family protein [Candidatus Thermoplasmatota archaeon]|jgi:uncharacterized protein YggU (UPF0235/DUF167 family)|nr:DUF167 family protein [Candidatus Thermoplasmatota archaeon]MCL5793212.1 DUF167 family protein [Candidatus Thermoplasmatota archaeon]